MYRYPAFFAIFLLLILTGSAPAQDCQLLSQQSREGVQGSPQRDIDLWSLYEYAQIARIAYGEAPRNSCEIADTGEQVALRIQDIRVIPLELHEYEALDFGSDAGYYYGRDGVLYVTCRRDRVIPQFAITAYRVFRDLSQGEPRLLDILLSVVLVRGPTALPGPREELGLVHLDRYGTSRNGPETLLAIRGTDPKRIAQILASAMDLSGGSCVFDVAARIVYRIENDWGGPFSVVGHSLGGSATQYVARERQQRQGGSQSATATFSAYSFNGIGLAGAASSASGLNSYYIDGEWVSKLGEFVGRKQAGKPRRYVPPGDWPSASVEVHDRQSFLDFLSGASGAARESHRRHLLHTVRKSICECLNGRGAIDRQYP